VDIYGTVYTVALHVRTSSEGAINTGTYDASRQRSVLLGSSLLVLSEHQVAGSRQKTKIPS